MASATSANADGDMNMVNKDETELLDQTETKDTLLPPDRDLHSDLHLDVQRQVFTQPMFDAQFQYTRPESPTCKEIVRKCCSKMACSESPTCKEIVQKRCSKMACSVACSKSLLNKVFPFVATMKRYKIKKDLIFDLMSGLTVGIMHIPQGMAYGMLANTSPVHGLYVSFFAPLIYFFFGTSKHVSLGTMAIVSLMVGGAVDKGGCPVSQSETVPTVTTAPPADLSSPTVTLSGNTAFSGNVTDLYSESESVLDDPLLCRVAVASVVALMVGLIQIGLGLLRLGFVTIYLSEPLTRAFTTAAGCHVFTSQLKNMTGIPVGRYSGAFKLIRMYIDLIKNLALINWASVIMSIVFGIILVIFKELINPKVKAKIKMPVPIELIVVIIATIISYFAKLSERFGMEIVGPIPRGIPAPVLPEFRRLPDFASDAFSIAIVAFAINLSLAKLFAKKHIYKVDANQELVSYGITNAISSAFNCFTNAAALSRSLLQEALGGKTQVAGLISCCFLLVILYGVGTLFESLPKNILAVIVVVNLKGMFWQTKDIPVLWRVSKPDCMVWLVVFLSTVLLDVDLGLLIGVAFCMLTVVFRTQSPTSHVLGQAADFELYRNSGTYEKVQENSKVRVFQFHAALYYANCEFFLSKLFKQSGLNPRNLKKAQQKAIRKQKKLETVVVKANNGKTDDPEILLESAAAPAIPQASISTIVIDCSVMSYIDSMGVSTLQQVIGEYKEVGVDLLLAGCHDGVRETLEAAEFFKKVPRSSLFVSIHDAVMSVASSQENMNIPDPV